MARLTEEEWLEVNETFSFARLLFSFNVEENIRRRKLVLQWIEDHCGGWFFHDDKDFFAFGRAGDYFIFKLWITGDPFEEAGQC